MYNVNDLNYQYPKFMTRSLNDEIRKENIPMIEIFHQNFGAIIHKRS